MIAHVLAACALAAAAAVAAAASGAAAPRPLHVGVHAGWAPTGAASEAAAWIASTAGDATAWSFLRALASSARDASDASDAGEHARVAAAARDVLPARACAALAWALAARVMSPRAAAHAEAGRALLARFGGGAALAAAHADAFGVLADGAAGSAALLLEPAADAAPAAALGDAALAAAIARPAPGDLALPCAGAARVLVVHADAAAPMLRAWLARRGAPCAVRLVLRHWRGARAGAAPVALQGFAVDVAVKSTEYRVVDDRVFGRRLFPDAQFGAPGRKHAPAADGELALTAFDAPFAGVAAAHAVRAAAVDGGVPAAVDALRLLAEDAPVALAAAVEGGDVDAAAARAAGALAEDVRAKIGRGDVLFVNGRPLPVVQAVAQSLPSTLRCLAAVAHAADALERAGAPRAAVAPLLHRGGAEGAQIDLRVKLVGEDANDVVTWYNDLTKDRRYGAWDEFENSTEGFTRYAENVSSMPPASGSKDFRALVKVRANLLSLVIALDPGDPRQMGFLSLPEQIVREDLPLRAGVILVPNNEVSTLVTAGFHYLRLGRGKKAAVSFIKTIQNILEYVAAYQGGGLSPHLVELAFQQVAPTDGGEFSSIAGIVDGHEEVNTLLQSARDWADAMGLFSGSAPVTTKAKGEQSEEPADAREKSRTFSMVSTINGILLKDVVRDALPVAVKEQSRIAQVLTAESPEGHNPDIDPTDWTKHDPSLIIVKRVSKLLLSDEPADILAGTGSVAERLSLAQLEQHKQEWSSLKYIEPMREDADPPAPGAVTLWLASCLHSSDSYTSAKSSLEKFVARPFVKRSNVRVGFLSETSQLSAEIAKCATVDEIESGVRYVINGRILPSTQVSSADDLEAEIAAEYLSQGSKFGAQQAENSNPWDAALLASAAIVDVDAACSSSSNGEASSQSEALSSVLRLASEAEDVSYVFPSMDKIKWATQTHPLTVVAVTDPLGESAPATAAFLTALAEAYSMDDIFVGLVLVPVTGVREEVPKARRVFSRFLLAPRAEFSAEGKLLPLRVAFTRLPQDSILTVDVKQPRPWFIASFAANYDMDNVILSSLPANVPALFAQYVLQSLLVEGSCVDERGQSPQGLQLEMARAGVRPIDTLVMGNLGYFQLRVPLPGQWGLALAPGRSSDIFSIQSIDSRLSAMYGAAGAAKHTFSADMAGGIGVFVDSLDGACGTLLRVKRKAGREGETVLGAPKGRQAPMQRAQDAIRKVGSLVKGMFDKTSGTDSSESAGDKDTIHVFSVASGHLYERFLKIMMLSVSKHATRPVKFWLLENYLSPSFKKMLPHFSEMHGFKVGMVTYRWPGWLREQSEKQRIIWAYKILYLDVLFPLSVRRIIFVDSDQVVRADLGELMDIDLKGAPYGYVPFCDSRKEVEGYRFWKTGFWETTLRGAKYHISALYVVDLQTLRGTASGDKLRAMYQSLSADPNSLSNLDQDLPNYASAVPSATGGNVPIFGLPQDWLWCESWCDDESKKTAKTIDLCNNPMTKEPKLVSAKRIIGEWTSLDDEAGNATETIYASLSREQEQWQQGSVTGNAADPDSNSVKDEL